MDLPTSTEREKRPNDLLLASLVPVVTEIGLAFCILGDFNEPPNQIACIPVFS